MPEKVYSGGIDQLDSVENSTDAHQAVGRWWAHAILKSSFDNGEADSANQMAQIMAVASSIKSLDGIESKIGGFAEALADLSREHELDFIRVDYNPGQILVKAAALAEMPINDMFTFPWKSGTSITDGIVSAQLGYNQGYVQIWPPTAEPV